MKRFLGAVALAAAASAAVFGFGAVPASADENTCVWYEDGDEYPVGTVKEEFWGTENRPGGRVEHRFRLFRCEPGSWWNYVGDKYYPAGGGGDDDDDDDWGGGGGGGGGWGCSTDPWDWGWDWPDWPDPLCEVTI
jgi:hypothetical protein